MYCEKYVKKNKKNYAKLGDGFTNFENNLYCIL